MKCMPDICPFWDNTTLFSPVKVHQKERKLATNSQNCQSMPKFHIFCAKTAPAWKKSTPRPVVVVVTKISYDEMSAIMVTRYTLAKCSLGRGSNNQNGNLRWLSPLGVVFYPTFFLLQLTPTYLKRILHFKNITFKSSYNWFKIDIHQQLRPLTANYLAMFKVILTTIYT